MITIVLATFNGEKYLKELLESIFSQTCQEFQLIVGDDHSTDGTLAILEVFQTKYPGRMEVHAYKDNLGPRENFARILENVTDDYILFADQDDVWLPQKIELSLSKMLAMEEQYGSSTPLLVHSDLTIVSEDLRMISPSWKQYASVYPQSYQINRLLIRNVIPGCSVMINRELLFLALPLPKCGMHDYWIALVAASLGQIGLIEEATLLYRQHTNNVIGAKLYNFSWFWNEILTNREIKEVFTARILSTLIQAYVLYQRYKEILPEDVKIILKSYILIKNRTFPSEWMVRVRYGFLDPHFWLNAALLYGSFRTGKLKANNAFKI